jgi:hypothetical protein
MTTETKYHTIKFDNRYPPLRVATEPTSIRLGDADPRGFGGIYFDYVKCKNSNTIHCWKTYQSPYDHPSTITHLGTFQKNGNLKSICSILSDVYNPREINDIIEELDQAQLVEIPVE